MNRGLGVPETAHLRLLVVGSSSWLQTATAALEDGAVTVRGPFESEADLEADTLADVDCLLTDDPDALAAISGACAVVCAVESVDGETLEELQRAGVSDVVRKSTVDAPALLEHRLRQATQLVTTRETVAQQETWYQTLLEQSSDLLLVIDAEGTITSVGQTVERALGVDSETVLDTHLTTHVHPEDTAAVRTAIEDLRERPTGETTTVEYRFQHATDGWFVHEAVLTNWLEEGGGIVISIKDVTDRHHVERELDESFERVTDAFYALDSEHRLTYLNERAADLLGVDQSAVLGRSVLEEFPALEGTVFHEAALEAMDTQEPTSLEQYYEPADRWYAVRLYPSPSGISVYFRNVTDRVERNRALEERTERLETLVENVPVVLFVLDVDGTITLAEGRALDHIDGCGPDIVGESVFDVFDTHSTVLEDAQTALDGQAVHSVTTLEDRVFEAWWQPIIADDSLERVIGTAVDITERTQYHETLNVLHEATRHLLTVESKQAACEYMVDVAADVLDLESVVYRFDEHQNELLPAAYAPELESTIGTPPRLEPTDSSTWQTFVSETPLRLDDSRDSASVSDSMAAARSGLFVPIGEHGVLVALDPEPGQYDDETFELAQLFAATAEAALDRIGRTHRLHRRERELKQQNAHLERINDANEVRQDIEQLLLMADSRTEIEQGICDRLADLEACSFVWIGEPDPGGNQLHGRTQAGLDRGYLDAVAVTTVDDSAAEPTGRAARTRETVYIENVAGAVRDGAWRVEALSRTIQSVYTVPLVYDDFLYGVVSLYGDDRDAFDAPLRSMLADLGERIGYAIDAVKRKPTHRPDGVGTVELELELDDDSPLCRLADRLATRLEYEGETVRADGVSTVFATVDTDDVPADTATLEDLEGIQTVSVITETAAETLLQLQCPEPFFGSAVDTQGGTLRSFVADRTGSRAIVDVPETIEIRDVLAGLGRRGFPASMIARREQSTDELSTIDIAARNSLLERLTDRQWEVVQTAYHGGFFEWPRRTTGEALADSLEISSPAFHKHIRATEQKLFTALFDGTSNRG
ncbi:PAS domain S-box protein [Natronorubrum sulfidifaciens]|uniref:PAS/PAC sensor protein n=1 Tax=Natronorubrum sulfidifaciens JCM 14089 TaxID=1230460 RepID=L9W170_9EURY|nr:PAS domain S-box protein [Natronorubrum sulfidifaciens]ELY42048.1 PAS/PAC sensor protein [Natronorubrum sulfidifaciens JCM 14089]